MIVLISLIGSLCYDSSNHQYTSYRCPSLLRAGQICQWKSREVLLPSSSIYLTYTCHRFLAYYCLSTTTHLPTKLWLGCMTSLMISHSCEPQEHWSDQVTNTSTRAFDTTTFDKAIRHKRNLTTSSTHTNTTPSIYTPTHPPWTDHLHGLCLRQTSQRL